MAALTSGRATQERDGVHYRGPVAADVVCYEGGLACRDAAGNLTPGAVDDALVAVGIFTARADNTGGAAAAINAEYKSGVFAFENSAAADAITKADIGSAVYVVDDQTVAKTDGTGARSAAGTCVDVDDAGVWVRVGI